MDKNAIKKYAVWARNELISRVAQKADQYGITEAEIISASEDSIYGRLLTPAEKKQRTALIEIIKTKGYKQVIEEVAYTWFNRIVAIRILQKNALIQPVLQFVEGFTRMPQIVFDAKRGRYPEMTTEERMRLQSALQDESRVVEQFSILITAFCHSNPILNNCFGKVADYSELLLPNDILADGGFIDMLNQTDYITDEDYRTTAWLLEYLRQLLSCHS